MRSTRMICIPSKILRSPDAGDMDLSHVIYHNDFVERESALLLQLNYVSNYGFNHLGIHLEETTFLDFDRSPLLL